MMVPIDDDDDDDDDDEPMEQICPQRLSVRLDTTSVV